MPAAPGAATALRGAARGLGALALLVAAAVPGAALDPARPLAQYSFDLWRTTDGLPQNTVLAVLQTRDGYLWVGTEEGLARFDGLAFRVFDTSNSPIRHNYVVCLYEDREGALWAGTFNGGVTRLLRGQLRTWGAAEGLSSNGVSAIAQDEDGSLWLGTTDAGLNHFRDGRVTVYRAAQGLPDDRIQALLRDRDGSLWIATASGLVRRRGGRFERHAEADGLAGAFVTSLEQTRDGSLWVGTTGGLARFQAGTLARYGLAAGLPNANVHALSADGHDSLWIGTDQGLTRLRDGRFESLGARGGLGPHAVMALAGDREGSLWVGMDGGALARLKDGKMVTLRSRDPRWRESVNALVGDGEGGLWLGSSGGEISRLRQGGISALASHQALGNGQVRALHRDGADLWIGTDQGLHVYRDGRFRSFSARDGLPQAAVRAIYRDRRGSLWVGTDEEGLARREGQRFVVYREQDGLAGNRVRFIHEDRRGRLWIGAYGGLSLHENGRFTSYGPRQGLPDALVRSVYEDEDGVLWLGTYGGGLIRFQDGRFASFGTRNGLPSDVIYGISEDAAHNLWMSGNKGIFRASRRELNALAAGKVAAVHVLALGADEGMKGNECNGGNPAVWRMPDGTLWFPTLKGIVRLDPARLPVNALPPPVVIESVTADGHDVELTGGARLPAGRPRIEVRFAAPSFVSPGRVRASYRLDGFDPDWVDAGTRRVAHYTNLPPGAYTFRVKAANEDGVASAAAAQLALEQLPRFYETRVFAAAALLAVALAAFGAYRLRLAQLRRHERELERRVAEALASVKVLSGLLPICAACKKIRDDKGYWKQIETYIEDHSEADFSHGICPDCVKRLYPRQAERLLAKGGTPTS